MFCYFLYVTRTTQTSFKIILQTRMIADGAQQSWQWQPTSSRLLQMATDRKVHIYLKWVEVASKIVHAVDYVGRHFYWYKNLNILGGK